MATANAHDGSITITVSDTGIGFDAEMGAPMFEPFHQGPRRAPQGGLGLGLAIARGLVEAHGGTIAARGDGPDSGACFVVELPTTTALLVDVPHLAAQVPSATREPLTILLVEDHEDTATALAFVLEHAGYTVKLAHSVQQAIATAKASEVDMVVSDLGLPDGSGLDLVR
ncbi:MAG: ATP-binding protein, partial [Candidatus Binatia bacterium]